MVIICLKIILYKLNHIDYNIFKHLNDKFFRFLIGPKDIRKNKGHFVLNLGYIHDYGKPNWLTTSM